MTGLKEQAVVVVILNLISTFAQMRSASPKSLQKSKDFSSDLWWFMASTSAEKRFHWRYCTYWIKLFLLVASSIYGDSSLSLPMHQRWEKTIKRFENYFHLVMKSVAHYLFQCILWFALIIKVRKTGHVRKISKVFNGSGTNQYLYFPLIWPYFCRTSENPKAPSLKIFLSYLVFEIISDS